MPLPIDLVEQGLSQYLSLFRGCFSQPQWQHFVTVLLALMQCQEHRTLSALLRQVAGVGHRIDGLHRFFKFAPWQPEQLAARWWRHYCRTLGPLVAAEHGRQYALRAVRRGRPRKTVVTGFLILDDSTHAKPRGKKMEGLGCHYSTTEGKPIRGHSMLAGLYVLLFDSWYACRRIWRAALARGWAVTGGLKSNRKMRLQDPEQGYVYRSLSEYTASLTDADYERVPWPHEDGSSRPVYAHLVKTFVKALGSCQVLAVREKLDQPLKEVRFWATSDKQADLITVVGWAAQRWAIEPFFGDVKEVLGTDHYQLRSTKGLIRFWHLAFLAYCYLEEQRALLLAQGADPTLTIGQTRLDQQKRHRFLLLDWIHDRYSDGLTPQQVHLLLAP